MGKTGLTNCFGGWVLKPISFRNWPLELSITLAAKCCIARSQVADIHEKRSIGNFGLTADLRCTAAFPRNWRATGVTDGPLRTFARLGLAAAQLPHTGHQWHRAAWTDTPRSAVQYQTDLLRAAVSGVSRKRWSWRQLFHGDRRGAQQPLLGYSMARCSQETLDMQILYQGLSGLMQLLGG